MTFDYRIIYNLVCDVPKGDVASYGMIASLLPGVTARMVGRALRETPKHIQTPWHRIVQASGAIALREGASRQRELLKSEGVAFRKNGCVDWKVHRWGGPSQGWLEKTGADPITIMETVAGWKR